MTKETPQYIIATYPPNGDDFAPVGPNVPPGAGVAEGAVKLDVEIVGGNINVKMEDWADSDGKKGDFVGFDPAKNRKILKIKRSSRIELILDPSKNWWFDPNIEPIRFADEDAAKNHYRVTRVPGDNQRMLIEATRAAGVYNKHSFNIYIMLKQNLGQDLAIRIDPDMDNPPR